LPRFRGFKVQVVKDSVSSSWNDGRKATPNANVPLEPTIAPHSGLNKTLVVKTSDTSLQTSLIACRGAVHARAAWRGFGPHPPRIRV